MPSPNPYSSYRSRLEGQPCYIAGLPTFPRNFTRDGVTAGIIAMEEEILSTQINFSVTHQGQKSDSLTGEELGKIHHEFPGVSLPDRKTHLFTTYNACDTSSYFLIAFEALSQINPTHFANLNATHRSSITLAVDYLLRHMDKAVFTEWPPPPATRFELNVTYWKDSVLPNSRKTPGADYPIAYALAHFLAARALQSAAFLLERPNLANFADRAFKKGIEIFLTEKEFIVATGVQGQISHSSSDELHLLAYLPARYKPLLPLDAIQSRATQIETPLGYACNPLAVADQIDDRYHGYVVWPFEQALIHYGSQKFDIKPCAKVAARVLPHIQTGHELFNLLPEVQPAGNPRQLWSVAAQQYFLGHSALSKSAWL